MCQKNLFQFQYWDNAIYVFDLNWFSEADYTKNILRLANNMLPVLSEEVIVDQSLYWKHDWKYNIELTVVCDVTLGMLRKLYFNTHFNTHFFPGFFAFAVRVLYSDLTSKLKSMKHR